MRRLIVLALLAIPMAFSLFLAPAAQASTPATTSFLRPTPYTVSRTFGPFDGTDTTLRRRLTVQCRSPRDTLVSGRVRVDNRVLRLRRLGVLHQRGRDVFAVLVSATGRTGEESVTLTARCVPDRRFDRFDRFDRGPSQLPAVFDRVS